MCIPFKFLFEYRALKKDIRRFSAEHVSLRHIALSAAYRSAGTDDRGSNQLEMQAQLWDLCLHTRKADSKEAYELLGQLLDVFFQHCERLFQIPERDYLSLIRQAYPSSEEYRSFLDQLDSLEQSIDRVAHRSSGDEGSDQSTRQRQKAIQDLRDREFNDIFPA